MGRWVYVHVMVVHVHMCASQRSTLSAAPLEPPALSSETHGHSLGLSSPLGGWLISSRDVSVTASPALVFTRSGHLGVTCTATHVWRAEDSFKELSLSFPSGV